MDNKKWGSRFATIFWWSLTILPFVIPLIQFIGFHLTFNSGISSSQDLIAYHSAVDGQFDTILSNFINGWSYFSISFIRDMFNSLFISLSFTGNTLKILTGCFAWMVTVQFFHLLFDFIVWLPRWMHKIMGKGFDDLQ